MKKKPEAYLTYRILMGFESPDIFWLEDFGSLVNVASSLVNIVALCATAGMLWFKIISFGVQ